MPLVARTLKIDTSVPGVVGLRVAEAGLERDRGGADDHAVGVLRVGRQFIATLAACSPTPGGRSAVAAAAVELSPTPIAALALLK